MEQRAFDWEERVYVQYLLFIEIYFMFKVVCDYKLF